MLLCKNDNNQLLKFRCEKEYSPFRKYALSSSDYLVSIVFSLNSRCRSAPIVAAKCACSQYVNVILLRGSSRIELGLRGSPGTLRPNLTAGTFFAPPSSMLFGSGLPWKEILRSYFLGGSSLAPKVTFGSVLLLALRGDCTEFGRKTGTFLGKFPP
jgi:hypothetical protein